MYLKKSIRKSAVNLISPIDLGPILEKQQVYKLLEGSPTFLGCPSHAPSPGPDQQQQVQLNGLNVCTSPQCPHRCEDSGLARWKRCFFWTETVFPGSSHPPPTVGLPHTLGRVHTLNNRQGKTNWHSRPTLQQACLLGSFLDSLQEQFKTKGLPLTIPMVTLVSVWYLFNSFSIRIIWFLILGPNTSVQRTCMTVPSRALVEYVCLSQCLMVQDIGEFPL